MWRHQQIRARRKHFILSKRCCDEHRQTEGETNKGDLFVGGHRSSVCQSYSYSSIVSIGRTRIHLYDTLYSCKHRCCSSLETGIRFAWLCSTFSLSVSLSVGNLIVLTNMLNDEQTNNTGVVLVFNVLIIASLHLHMVVSKLQTGMWRRHAHFYRCISTGKAVRRCVSMIEGGRLSCSIKFWYCAQKSTLSGGLLSKPNECQSFNLLEINMHFLR